jgi:hypothetical protein
MDPTKITHFALSSIYIHFYYSLHYSVDINKFVFWYLMKTTPQSEQAVRDKNETKQNKTKLNCKVLT